MLIPSTFAKFTTSKILKGNTKIAKPIFIVQGLETCKISAINNIGYYEFSVKNYNADEISETGFLYDIEILSKADEVVKFELFREGQEIKLEDLKTEGLTIQANEKIEQKYKLKVTYDKNKTKQAKDILEEVQIRVHSEQAKIG